MPFKRCLTLFILFLFLASTATAQSTLSFPCDPELSPFLAASEHEISREIDLQHWYRMAIDYWGDDMLMIESGSLLVLDMQFVMINLRFSKDYDYDAHYAHLPEVIMLVNHDPNVINDNDPPEWRVMMYPDQDDPYSFHYIGTWNRTMVQIQFYGSYVNPQGEHVEGFTFDVDIF